jgi:hypothetical protein
MKKILLIAFLTILFLGMNSCGKDSTSNDNNYTVYQVPVDLASKYVALALCNATTGINYHMEKAAGYAARGTQSLDSSFMLKKSDSSATVKYLYQVVYNYAIVTSAPLKTAFDYTADGSFSSSSIQSQDSQLGDWNITVQDASHFSLNGTGHDGGSQLAVLDKVFFQSQINYTLQNVLVDKMTGMVSSGSAQIKISGAGPAGVQFSYSGTLTFSGNRSAVLVIGGATYNLNLTTGGISK